MKIRMLATVHDPLSGRIFAKEAQTLVSKYADVGIIAPWHEECAQVDGVSILGLRCPKRRVIKRMCRLVKLFWRAWKEQPDVYHCHELDSLLIGVVLKRFRGGHLVFDCHEYHPEKLSGLMPARLRRASRHAIGMIERTLAHSADAVIAVNEHLASRFRRFHPRVVVLPNYPRLSFVENLDSSHREEQLTLVYAGNLSPARGLSEMVQVIAKLQASAPGARLMILGRFADKEYERTIRHLAAELGVEHLIEFTGRLPHDQVPLYLQRAHIGLFLLQPTNPAHDWGEPMKFFEYSAAGLPMVVSDLPAKRKLVEFAKNGILVPPTDIDTIAAAVVELWKSPGVREEMGRNGRSAFVNTFNWEAVESRLLALYAELEPRRLNTKKERQR